MVSYKCFSLSSALVLPFLLTVVACATEERAIYLVLLEGEAVAFHHHQGSSVALQQGKRVDPNSEGAKAHAQHLVSSHDRLLQVTLDRGFYSKLYSFKHIINGFAVHTTRSQAEKLKQAPGVKFVERDTGAKLMTTYTPQFLKLPQGLYRQLRGGERNAGRGIVIGFVDSGINPEHPSFAYDPRKQHLINSSRGPHKFSGACEVGPMFPASSCNGKIASARFFSEGAQAMVTLNSSVDLLSPFDAVGHGSHVASTAAGNPGVPVVVNGFHYGRASGMAPNARIAMYKAIYPSIGTLADVAAAIDQAAMDGVDILTLSIGPDGPPEDTITFLSVYEIFMLYAQRAGVFVVQAAGNQGPTPSSVVSFSPWAVAAAACDTDRTYPGTLLLGNGMRIGGAGLSRPAFRNGKGQYKLVLAKDAVTANGTYPRTPQYIEECQFPDAFNSSLVQGSVVICTFSEGFSNGTSSLVAIFNTANHLGFTGFILVANPVYGDFVAEPVPFTVPGIMVPSVADANRIMQYYRQHTQRDARGSVLRFGARAATGEGRVAFFTSEAPIVTRFSSRGPNIIDSARNPVDVLKPDILAPGHQVWAAWSPLSALDPILRGYNFALVSGTSMAAPHVAGVAALIKQAHPTWTPSMIASALSTTAIRYDNLGEPIMAEGYDANNLYPAVPFDFGSGLINPPRAVDPGLVLQSGFQDYISFLCSLPHTDNATLRDATGQTCNRSLSYPSDLNLPSVTISSLTGFRLVRRSVMNVGNKEETYLGSVLPPNGVAVSLRPPWFTIAPQETQDLEIQFNVTQAMDAFSFGEIVLIGSLDHIVRMPLSVLPVSMG